MQGTAYQKPRSHDTSIAVSTTVVVLLEVEILSACGYQISTRITRPST